MPTLPISDGGRATVGTVAAAAAEALTLEDLGGLTLSSLARAVGAQETILWERTADGAGEARGGTLAWYMPRFLRRYEPLDPFLAGHRSAGVPITRSSVELVRAFRGSEAHEECYAPLGLGHILLIRIAGDGYEDPGMAMIGLFRPPEEPSFTGRAERVARYALPALSAAARRANKVAPLLRARPAIEALVESLSPRPCLVLDGDGRLLWMSPRAERLQPGGAGNSAVAPQALIDLARTHAAVDGDAPAPPPPAAVTVPGRGSLPLRIELHVVRTPEAGAVLVAELDDFTQPGPALAELAAARGLTRAETAVLGALTLGLTNREIARRFGVSVATVRTHVARILRKLDVSSRTEASLLARGGGMPVAGG